MGNRRQCTGGETREAVEGDDGVLPLVTTVGTAGACVVWLWEIWSHVLLLCSVSSSLLSLSLYIYISFWLGMGKPIEGFGWDLYGVFLVLGQWAWVQAVRPNVFFFFCVELGFRAVRFGGLLVGP